MRYAQPATGFRSGIEPVLLAASIPAHAGQRVIEGGSGAGAALLCLACRVDVLGLGVEREPALAAIARDNARANGFAGLRFEAGDVASAPAGPFDHALANPPYHRGGTASPDPAREDAKRATDATLPSWIAALARRLTPSGTLTLILPAAALEACVPAFVDAGCGSIAIHPLWPRAGAPAKLMLARATRSGRGACRLLAGLALHEADGGFTPQAEAVLRDGASLVF